MASFRAINWAHVTLMRAVRYGLGVILALVVLLLLLSAFGISIAPLLARVKSGMDAAGIANSMQRAAVA